MTSENIPRPRLRRALFVLWVSFLAFALPEVFAGTGRLWLFRSESYLLVIPVYALHFLLLVHIAVRTRRTSWPALYLFGVIFGLYETWITKVVWTGYPGSDGFAMGSFGPWFGIHETLGLVLFYHPVTSFLLPLAVISFLFPAFGRHFPQPDWIFGATKKARATRIALVIIWGSVAGHNVPVPGDYLATWLPMIVLLWLGYLALRKGEATGKTDLATTIADPVLGKVGITLVALAFVALHAVTYEGLAPQNLPPGLVQVLTACLYLPLVFLIRRTEPVTGHESCTNANGWHAMRWLLAVFGIGLVVSALSAQAGGTLVPVTSSFIAMVPLGAGLFLWLAIWRGLLKRG